MSPRVVAVDFSLTSTGLACIDADGPRVERVQSKAPAVDGHLLAVRSARMRRIAGTVHDHCAGADLVVIEGPSYDSGTGKAHDRSGAWWMIVGRLTGAGVPVVEIPPSTMKVYALGTGRGDKDLVLATTIHRYGHLCRVLGNDQADALQLAAMGWHHLTGSPLIDLPQTHTRALTAVKWPQITRSTPTT